MISNDLIPQQIFVVSAIICGIICIYLTELPYVGAVFSIIITVLAMLYGTNTTRRIGSSSLADLAPPVDYMLMACGIISSISGMTLSVILNIKFLFPVISIMTAALTGYIISLILRYVLNIDDPVLTGSFMSVSISTMLGIIGMSTLIVSGYDMADIYQIVMKNGLLILLIVITILVKQVSFNACDGPNEDQYRTLSLSLSYTFLMLAVVASISMLTNPYWIFYVVVCMAGWLIFLYKFCRYVKHQAASIRYHGFSPGRND